MIKFLHNYKKVVNGCAAKWTVAFALTLIPSQMLWAQTSLPVEASGWEFDGVAEKKPASSSTTDAVASNYAFFTSDVQEKGAFCDAQGNFKTDKGHNYKIFNLAGNNMVKIGGYATKTLTLAQPAACKQLHILLTSETESDVHATVYYEDGTSMAASRYHVQVWTGDEERGGDDALYGMGAITRDGKDEFNSSYTIRANELTIDTDAGKKITQIGVFNSKWGSYPVVLGISKTVEGTSGINGVNGTDSAQPVEICTPDGTRLTNMQRGLNIVKYADGSVKKVLVK